MVPTCPSALAFIGTLDPLHLLVLILTTDTETFLGIFVLIVVF